MKYIFVLIFLVMINSKSLADTGKVYHGNIKRLPADTDTIYRKRSITIGANYGSDVLFFGRTGPIKYPFVGTDVIYNTKSGFFIYGSEIKVLGYEPFIDEIDLGTGYLYNYTRRFTGTISYTHFFFNKDAAQVIRSASTNDINFKNAYDWKIAKSSIVTDYLFGKASDFFITLNTSKYIETNFGIFDDKDYISFNPTVSAIFGTQNFVQQYSDDHRYITEFNNIFLPGYGGPGQGFNNGRFNALNYSFKLPVAYNRPHYTLEASWKYAIPVNVEDELHNRHEVFFNLTFFYVFY